MAKKLVLVLLLLTGCAMAQGVRFGDGQPIMIAGSGNVLSGKQASLAFCNAPANAVPCTNYATTYTDSTLVTACSTSTQVVLAGSGTCQATTDSVGSWGVWVAPGQYAYTFTIAGVSYGPYAVTAAGVSLSCAKFSGAFEVVMAACISALPASGAVTADATGLSGSQLTMGGDWTMSRSGTAIVWGAYQVAMGSHKIIIPAGTNNVSFKGATPWATIPLGTVNGTFFQYTGAGGTALSFGGSSATSHGHLVEDIAVDLSSGASGSAHAIDSTRVFTSQFSRVRGLCPVAANAMTFLQQNGTSTAPGDQSAKFDSVVESNCQFGVTSIGGTSPPLCNNNQFIGGQFSGNSNAGSIAIDIECGNDNTLVGPYIAGYDIGLKVNSPSARAVHGDIHVENCGTWGIQLTSAANNNHIFTDSGCALQDLGVSPGQNTLHDPAYSGGTDWFYGAITALSTTKANQFYSSVNFRGNAGLPAAVNGGSGGFITAGSGALGFYCGDGTGINCDFYKRTGSSDTLVFQLRDSGLIKKYGAISTVSNGVPAEYAEINSTGNTGSIGSATLYAVPGAGLYRISYYVATQSAGSAGTVSLTLGWSDGLTTKSFTTGTADLTVNTLASVVSGSYIVRSDVSQNISYATTVSGAASSPTYVVYIRVEAL